MGLLPNQKESRAVLVGISKYTYLPDLPSIHNNLVALQQCLCDDTIWGLPPENCAVVSGPSSNEEMLDAVDEAAASAHDTLLIYYAGHGLVDPDDGTLWLTIAGSKAGKFHTCPPYQQVQRLLVGSRAKRRIVFLDCCYSGRAIGGMAGPASTAIEQTTTEGVFVLTATPENREALAPPGEKFTAFTGELVQLLRHGIPGGQAALTLDLIYAHLVNTLRAKRRPQPQKRARNAAGSLPLVHNTAFVSAQILKKPQRTAQSGARWERHLETYRVLFGRKGGIKRGGRFPRRAMGYSPNEVDDLVDAACEAAWKFLAIADPNIPRGGSPEHPTLEYPSVQAYMPLSGSPMGPPSPSRSVPISTFKIPRVQADFPKAPGGYDRGSVKIWQEACAMFVQQIWEMDESLRHSI